MSEARHPHIVNVEDVEPYVVDQGPKFAAVCRAVGRASGGKAIGCTWMEIPPGKTAFPFHYHCSVEEGVFVLEGEGTLRLGDETFPLRAGDYVTFPTGPGFAHQILNTGTGPLRYLGLSSASDTDLVGYPDSKKFGAVARSGGKPVHRFLFRETGIDYFDGEE